MKKPVFILFLLLCVFKIRAQQHPADSLRTLDSISLHAFSLGKKSAAICIPVSVVRPIDVVQTKNTILTALNAEPGVRMEERSPGSYRISIRGSSLRSPFGVRNIKVYWNDIPVTDPGGNTYFNQFAFNNFSYAELAKGPAGSMYGAGTGGLILLNSFAYRMPVLSAEVNGGSYGQLHAMAQYYTESKENKNLLTYSHLQADGYRDHTRMHRDNASWSAQLKNGEHGKTSFSLLYTHLYYQTPGALTLTEYKNNPRASRPQAGALPSAIKAKAAVDQQNLLAGITQETAFSARFKNRTTVYGYYTDFKNAAIRNYERRKEPSLGGRTVFNYHWKAYAEPGQFDWYFGAEYQSGFFNTVVSGNKNGNPDTIQTNDDVKTVNSSVFTQATYTVLKQVDLLAGLSLNQNRVTITRLNQYPVIDQQKKYRNEIMPRFSLIWRGEHNWTWFLSAARGFSPPSVAELLPSTGVITTNLEAEEGWNYETTIRKTLLHGALRMQLTGFSFRLQNALVPRRDLSGADYFVNAGYMIQRGLEAHADYSKEYFSSVRLLRIRGDLALNHFRYGNFSKDGVDYSGKQTPSIPSATISFQGESEFRYGWYASFSFYHAASIYLNDANTAKADPYSILSLQGARLFNKGKRAEYKIYIGAENLLNQTYSLGNDINAAGGRYYNAAAGRNVFGGVIWSWKKKVK